MNGGLLLDTNVISELVKKSPDPNVVDWVARQVPSRLFLSVITLGELTRGVIKLDPGKRRDELDHWVNTLFPRQFPQRILLFEETAAKRWGKLLGDGDRAGRPPSVIDAQIAAIALEKGLIVVTRNTAHFQELGVAVINPWDNP